MSDVKMVILNSGEEQQRLENHVFVGLITNKNKVFLSSIGFQLKSDPTKVVVVNSDDLKQYISISKIGGLPHVSDVRFDNVPYSVVVGGSDINKKITVDFDKRTVSEVATFSFGLTVVGSEHAFSFHFPNLYDPLDLFKDIVGASFSFIITSIGDQ